MVCCHKCCMNTYACECVSAMKLLVCDYILNNICVVGVYEHVWPSAIPVFMSYTITHPWVLGKSYEVVYMCVWVGVYLGPAVLVCFSLLVNHTHTWSGGEADCGSSGVFLNRFFVRSAFKTPLLNSPHSPLSPLFSPPLYLLLSSHTQLLPWCRLLMLLYHLLGSICEDPWTLSPKFSHAFFRIRYPKNLSRTETLHTESDMN